MWYNFYKCLIDRRSFAFSCADIIRLDQTLLSLHKLQILRQLNAIISSSLTCQLSCCLAGWPTNPDPTFGSNLSYWWDLLQPELSAKRRTQRLPGEYSRSLPLILKDIRKSFCGCFFEGRDPICSHWYFRRIWKPGGHYIFKEQISNAENKTTKM